MMIDAAQAHSQVLEEYPVFMGHDLAITRRFQTAGGRMFNTFLLESTKPGFERFIAKGVVHQEYGSLDLEWSVLALLRGRAVRAPKLLVPDHRPQQFLLLE